MEKFFGKSVYKAITLGKVLVFARNENQIKRRKIEDVDGEIVRLESAIAKATEQLQELYEKAVKEVGEASAAIFEFHQMMLEDDDYLDSMHEIIRGEEVNAEYAVAQTGDNFSAMFAGMEDDYMKARAIDVKDVSERLVRILSGAESNGKIGEEPVIIVADDLSPSETVQMDKEKILAFVTVHGSTNSHTAILARMMNIPAIIGVESDIFTIVIINA